MRNLAFVVAVLLISTAGTAYYLKTRTPEVEDPNSKVAIKDNKCDDCTSKTVWVPKNGSFMSTGIFASHNHRIVAFTMQPFQLQIADKLYTATQERYEPNLTDEQLKERNEFWKKATKEMGEPFEESTNPEVFRVRAYVMSPNKIDPNVWGNKITAYSEEPVELMFKIRDEVKKPGANIVVDIYDNVITKEIREKYDRHMQVVEAQRSSFMIKVGIALSIFSVMGVGVIILKKKGII